MNIKNLLLVLLLAVSVPVFAQEADMSLIPYREGELWGYANPLNNIIIKPEYQEANLFYEGFAVVKKGDKYGYIDKEGKVVIPIKYFTAKPFRIGYFPLSGNAKAGDGSLNAQKTVLFAGASPAKDGYEICIDTKGQKMPKCPAINESSAPDLNKPNTVTVVSNYSTIQKSDLFDKIIDDYKMPGAEDSYYIAVRNNKYGVFNKTFEVIVPFEYDKIEKLNMGIMVYLIAEKEGLKGMMFGNGSLYMPIENTRLQYVHPVDGSNYIIFTKDGKTGIKNSKYKMVAEPIYEDISYIENRGFVLTGLNSQKGFCFLNDNILEPKYMEIIPLKGGEYIIVKAAPGKAAPKGSMGYINNILVEFFKD